MCTTVGIPGCEKCAQRWVYPGCGRETCTPRWVYPGCGRVYNGGYTRLTLMGEGQRGAYYQPSLGERLSQRGAYYRPSLGELGENEAQRGASFLHSLGEMRHNEARLSSILWEIRGNPAGKRASFPPGICQGTTYLVYASLPPLVGVPPAHPEGWCLPADHGVHWVVCPVLHFYHRCCTSEGLAGGKRTFFPAENNSFRPGNRRERAKNTATESRPAQGRAEC